MESANNDIKEEISKIKEEIPKVQNERRILQLVDDSRKLSLSFADQRDILEKAAVKLAAPDIMEHLEHTLKSYSVLLDPNPRSMKLLVNAYSVNRVLAILSEVEIEVHQLVLWTILSSRWPQLASYLEEYPDMLDKIKIGQNDVSDIPDDLQPLFSDKEVVNVVQGRVQDGSLNGSLIHNTVKKYSQLHA
jgi:hypothetical protein